MWITRAALSHPVAVTLFYIAIALVGSLSYAMLGRSVLPSIVFPTISVTASYPGAGSSELERLVVEPVEDAMNGVAGVDRVSASAQNGVAQVIVQFRFGTSLQTAQTDVQQAVDAARVNLPVDLLPPAVVRDDPSQRPVIELAVSSGALDARALSIALDRKVLPALRSTAGVGIIRVGGEPQRIFTVRPNSGALGAATLTSLDVYRAMQGAATLYPGGYQVSGGAQKNVSVRADARSPQDLLDRAISLPNLRVVARDVATVRDGFDDPMTLSSYDGDDAMLLYVTATQNGQAGDVIAAVRRTLATLRQQVPLVRLDEYHSDQPFTDAAVSGVQQTLLEGIALTVITMLLFLHSWRNAAVAALAIPASLLATCIAMRLFGFSIDVLSLMGLAMTVGILVDDSIVIIEAIARAVEHGLRGDAAALCGRSELGGATIAITLVDVVVFAPVAAMDGIVGEFMREFAAVIVIATSFSLLVSFTLTPLLAARWATLLRAKKTLPWTFRTGPIHALSSALRAFAVHFNRFEALLVDRYTSQWLPAAWRKRRVIFAATALATIASCVPVVNGTIGTEFSPPADRGELLIDLTYPAGTPLNVTNRGVREFAARLLQSADVADVVTTAGRAFDGTSDVLASNIAEAGIELRDQTSDGAAVGRLAKSLGRVVPGASILESGRGMGGTAPISFRIAGDDRRLSTAAANLASLLKADPYADDVRRSDVGTSQSSTVRIDEGRANLLGVNSDDAALSARIATAGALATRVRTRDALTDVIVRTPANLSSTLVRSENGTLVPLSDVVVQTSEPEPLIIHRENRERVVSVTANAAAGAPVGRSVRDIAPLIAGALPADTRVAPRGDIEQFISAVSAMGRAFGLSILLAYVVLAILYRSYTLPLAIMTTVPLASIGAFGALAISGERINLYSMLGIILLIGLVAKNGVLLVEFAERAFREGAAPLDAMQRAASRRFRPVLMTTVAMIGGMLPLALGHSAGAEYRKALGIVVVGGLTSSLLLTFFLVPLIFMLLRREQRPMREFTLRGKPRASAASFLQRGTKV